MGSELWNRRAEVGNPKLQQNGARCVFGFGEGIVWTEVGSIGVEASRIQGGTTVYGVRNGEKELDITLFKKVL